MKSRLTLQDRRSFGDSEEITRCPTPSSQTNNLMEFLAIYFAVPMWCFDVVSAFPHADESSEMIFLEPPPEWKNKYGHAMIWWMRGSLDGRRSAGANFRDYLGDCLRLPRNGHKTWQCQALRLFGHRGGHQYALDPPHRRRMCCWRYATWRRSVATKMERETDALVTGHCFSNF